jgi:hypothetical protein
MSPEMLADKQRTITDIDKTLATNARAGDIEQFGHNGIAMGNFTQSVASKHSPVEPYIGNISQDLVRHGCFRCISTFVRPKKSNGASNSILHRQQTRQTPRASLSVELWIMTLPRRKERVNIRLAQRVPAKACNRPDNDSKTTTCAVAPRDVLANLPSFQTTSKVTQVPSFAFLR